MLIVLGNVKIEVSRTTAQDRDDAARRTYDLMMAAKAAREERLAWETQVGLRVPWLG